jgi:hypothetical protein
MASDRFSRQVEFILEVDKLKAVERMTLLHNFFTGGRVWRENEIHRQQVRDRMRPISVGAPALWDYAVRLIDIAMGNGHLTK